MTWSPERIARFAQHALLPDVGGRGQDRLRAATVTIAIGGPAARIAAVYLAAGGIGIVVLAGDDRVVDRGLARFPIGHDAIGASLHGALATALTARSPDVVVVSAGPSDAALTIPADDEGQPLATAFARGGEAAARWLHAIATTGAP